jgi:hypothetical protein
MFAVEKRKTPVFKPGFYSDYYILKISLRLPFPEGMPYGKGMAKSFTAAKKSSIITPLAGCSHSKRDIAPGNMSKPANITIRSIPCSSAPTYTCIMFF